MPLEVGGAALRQAQALRLEAVGKSRIVKGSSLRLILAKIKRFSILRRTRRITFFVLIVYNSVMSASATCRG